MPCCLSLLNGNIALDCFGDLIYTNNNRSDTMSPINEKAISNAAASLEMEGFVILPEYKKLCEKLLNKEITMAEYIATVKTMQGIE